MNDPEILDENTGEVVRYREDAITEFGHDEVGFARAQAIAKRLDSIIRERHLAVKIGGGEHIRVEAWCALASQVGLSPKTEWSHECRNPKSGDLEGYEARVEVVRIATGESIGAAEAGCYFDETMRGKPRWTERHAVKSMAQTRATSKAIGQVLRWIPVIAGYEGTPAEEMPVDRPASRGGTQPEETGSRGGTRSSGRGGFITEPQRKRMFALGNERARELGDESITGNEIVREVLSVKSITSTSAVERAIYEEVCAEIETWEVPGG